MYYKKAGPKVHQTTSQHLWAGQIRATYPCGKFVVEKKHQNHKNHLIKNRKMYTSKPETPPKNVSQKAGPKVQLTTSQHLWAGQIRATYPCGKFVVEKKHQNHKKHLIKTQNYHKISFKKQSTDDIPTSYERAGRLPPGGSSRQNTKWMRI